MTVRIALLRHGRTQWNLEGRLQGQTDTPLVAGEFERLQALRLPEEWRGVSIVSSPLRRAFDTARAVTGKMPATDVRLMEKDFGNWEGQVSDVLRADPRSGFRDVEHWGWDYRPHGGESPRDLWQRISPALSQLEQTSLIVCHLGVMRVVLARAYGWNFDGPMPFRVKRDRLYVVERATDGTLAPAGDPLRLLDRCE